jgi:AraC-like DNA-binding protein
MDAAVAGGRDRGIMSGDHHRVEIQRIIEAHSSNPDLSAKTVARELGVTARYVHFLLEETGRSFTQLLLERRLTKAAALLRYPTWQHRTIADVAAEAGFTDLSYFNRAFRRRFAMTPSAFRNAARRN